MLDNLLTESKNPHESIDLLTTDVNELDAQHLENDILDSARQLKQSSPASGLLGTGLDNSSDLQDRSTSRFGELSEF